MTILLYSVCVSLSAVCICVHMFVCVCPMKLGIKNRQSSSSSCKLNVRSNLLLTVTVTTVKHKVTLRKLNCNFLQIDLGSYKCSRVARHIKTCAGNTDFFSKQTNKQTNYQTHRENCVKLNVNWILKTCSISIVIYSILQRNKKFKIFTLLFEAGAKYAGL